MYSKYLLGVVCSPDNLKHQVKRIKQVTAKMSRIPIAIRKGRENLGLTQESLAEALDISVETLKAIESGRRSPSLPLFFHLCLFLKIDVALKIKN